VESTLDRCLKSVVEQSFADYEVILVDDGSTDRSPQLCDEWAGKDPRIKVVHQQNGGLSAARNTGIELSQGDYITFIDSDDYIGEGTLEAVMSRLDDGIDLIEYPIWRFYGAPHQSLLQLTDTTYDDIADYWLDGQAYDHTYACNKVYRRRLFDDVRFPVGRVFEDAYTLPRLLRKVRRVATTSAGCYYYCWNAKGITSTAQGNELRQLLDAHLTAQMPMDDRYYLKLVNIQIDVCELTGDEPRLEPKYVRPAGTVRQTLKAVALNMFGIKGICNISKIIHKVRKPCR
jgi:glycosyltransferase involved in cell wall biosynthesis